MRTVRTKVYSFNELSKEAQQKAILAMCDINVNFDWWDFTYEDAKEVGLILDGFDIERKTIGITISDSDYSANKIIDNHGPECSTYLTAKEYNLNKETILFNTPKDENNEFTDLDSLDSQLDQLSEAFTKQIGFDYLGILSNEYDYLISDEAIAETIQANDYEFTVDGKQF